ncbi:MAG TPA: TonB-dependent receptor plug domain-containing protein [Thermoguttaceae bacterium]|nr:TonB-dependent receptor plug domain-containing protein [Thermoguttaceae bacterium]
MATRRIARSLAIVTACILLGSGLSAVGLAQSFGNLYASGSDPVAPRLSAQEVDEKATEADAEAKKNDKEDKDDLDLLDLNLKDLSQVAVKSASSAMNAEVSTVSRTESTVGRSPAAVYVITNEMIRRSGARNVPEALRLAPGVQVAWITTNTWAISIRGFNGIFANKLLVQIDGRAVYTPGTASVHWDQQQVLLEDVERIEIIRGPGAAVWGANAVNGVINIVTKSSTETNGIYAYSGGGNEHRSFNAVRAGGRRDNLNWRVYGMQTDDGPGYWDQPGGAWDAFEFGQGGFRMDWTPNSWDTLTLQGDFLGAKETYQQYAFPGYLREPEDVRTTNFLGRWTRKLDDDRDWSLQTYYDNFRRMLTGEMPRLINLNTFDFDSQYHAKLGDRHDVVCGFGYRNYESTEVENGFISFDPPRDAFDVISYFVQDTLELRPDRLFLTAGVKLEHNDFTNFEYQPTIRLLVAPDDRTAIWGAVSRAVRTPAINERDINFLQGFILGNKDLRSEDMLAYELGIRRQPTDKLYWDLAAFFNRYDNLVGVTPLFPVLPEVVSNVGRGDTYGYELAVTYEVNPDWRLRGCYTFLVEDIDYPAGTATYVVTPGLNPRNQFSLQSGWDLSQATKLDMIWRYVDNLAAGVPHYLVMDVRVARQFRNGIEVALVGQNLLDDHHPEFSDFSGCTEVPAGVYGMVSWRY